MSLTPWSTNLALDYQLFKLRGVDDTAKPDAEGSMTRESFLAQKNIFEKLNYSLCHMGFNHKERGTWLLASGPAPKSKLCQTWPGTRTATAGIYLSSGPEPIRFRSTPAFWVKPESGPPFKFWFWAPALLKKRPPRQHYKKRTQMQP